MGHLIVRMKAGEMDGNIWSHLSYHPLCQSFEHLLRFVRVGTTRLTISRCARLLATSLMLLSTGRSFGAANVPVELVAEASDLSLPRQGPAHLLQGYLVHEAAQTRTERMCRLAASLAISIRYSAKTVGSFYVNTMTGARRDDAPSTIEAGETKGGLIVFRRSLGNLPVLAELDASGQPDVASE